MKNYEKPRLMFLSLNGNDRLCGDCANHGGDVLYQDPDGSKALILDFLVGNDDGVLTKEEAAKAFGPGESCEIEVDAYCKFQSIGENRVAWS